MRVLFGRNPMDMTGPIAELRKRFPDVQFDYQPDGDKIGAAIGDADVYMGWLNADIFKAAKRLRWIQSPSSGVNYFTGIPELRDSEVLLTSASGTHAASVAESTMAMILAHTRGIMRNVPFRAKHQWGMREIRSHTVVLTGSTMGILGLGAIGRAIAQRAKAFEMKVVAVDVGAEKPDTVDSLWGLDRLDDLLAVSDYLVVMVPYTAETEGMIGSREIGLMKKGAMLVIMSRGGIVDESAMVTALKEGHLSAAAMDVFATEPLPADSELWDLEGLVMAPHIAGGTQYEGDTLMEIFTENLEKLIKGESPLRNQVDKQKGY